MEVGVDCRADLFDRQFDQRVDHCLVVPCLPKSTAEQVAELRHVPVPMHATPAANFEVIHAVEKLSVFAVGFIECPGPDLDAV